MGRSITIIGAGIAGLSAGCYGQMNGYDNVTVLPVALSNRVAGVAERNDAFYVPDDGTAPPEEQSDAAAAVFDDLVGPLKLQRLDLVKIDVEGAELHVLEGMTRSLAHWAPDVLLEVHPSKLTNCGRSVSQLNAFLAKRGYETQPVSGPSESGVYTVYCVSRVRTTLPARSATVVAPSSPLKEYVGQAFQPVNPPWRA